MLGRSFLEILFFNLIASDDSLELSESNKKRSRLPYLFTVLIVLAAINTLIFLLFMSTDNFNYLYLAVPILIVFGALVAFYFVESGDTQKSQREFMPSDQQIIYLSKTIHQKNHSLSELKNLTAKNELYLDFLGECWIELYVGDELIEALYFDENDNYKKKIEIPFKIIVGNAEAIKGTYNGNEIDFMANANRLTKVNIINFDENKLD